ncbi:MAG: ATPase, partial [Phototrophicales bacterium]
KTYRLADPFMVLATQNPIEQEGTYPLPEAQLDRFMLKVVVEYPSRDEERVILDRMGTEPPAFPEAVIEKDVIQKARLATNQIYVDERVKDYILDIVFATRETMPNVIQVGASPRATLFLLKAARAHAFLRGRGYITPEDVKRIAPDVLRHRIIVTFEAEAEDITPEQVINQILSKVTIP